MENISVIYNSLSKTNCSICNSHIVITTCICGTPLCFQCKEYHSGYKKCLTCGELNCQFNLINKKCSKCYKNK